MAIKSNKAKRVSQLKARELTAEEKQEIEAEFKTFYQKVPSVHKREAVYLLDEHNIFIAINYCKVVLFDIENRSPARTRANVGIRKFNDADLQQRIKETRQSGKKKGDLICSRCRCSDYYKNGRKADGHQNLMCKVCGTQFSGPLKS